MDGFWSGIVMSMVEVVMPGMVHDLNRILRSVMVVWMHIFLLHLRVVLRLWSLSLWVRFGQVLMIVMHGSWFSPWIFIGCILQR